jgi:beta-lactamase class A
MAHDTQSDWQCSRRMALGGMATLLLTAACGKAETSKADNTQSARAPKPPVEPDQHQQWIAALKDIETKANGRLGAYILDTKTGVGFGWRTDERFPHCSSFKLSLAAMILRMAERGEADLDEVLRWTRADLLPTSPVTEGATASGLSVRALAKGTLVTSDNTAANVLLNRFGGPAAVTAFWRSLGDTVSQLDRFEPALNDTPAGTTLDTTTPSAMAHTVAKMVHGDALTPPNRALLKAWMAEVRTGNKRIRAGLPSAWESGDKTGTGFNDNVQTYVDLAYAGPKGRAPLIVTGYFEPATLSQDMAPAAMAVLADVGRIAAQSLT